MFMFSLVLKFSGNKIAFNLRQQKTLEVQQYHRNIDTNTYHTYKLLNILEDYRLVSNNYKCT